MTVHVIPPIALNSGNATSNAPSSDYADYAAGTTYALDAFVHYNGRDYKSLQASNTGNTPSGSLTWWVDQGPSNRWKMFDFERNTATTCAAPLTVTLTPAQRVNAVMFTGVIADTVTITQSVSGLPVFSATLNMLDRATTTWSGYFFGSFAYKSSGWSLDLLPYTASTVTVVFAKASGNVQCESLLLGTAEQIGLAQYGAETDIVDFSRIERDAFGTAILVRRKNVPRMSLSIIVDKQNVNKVRKLRETLTAQPAGWIGLKNPADDYAESIAMLGIYKRMPITIEYFSHSLVQLEVEGL